MADKDAVMQRLYFNGVHASGNYLLSPMAPEDLSRVARGETLDRQEHDKVAFQELLARKNSKRTHYGLKAGADANQLDQSGWAVILPAVKPGTPEDVAQQEILDALKPLLDWRKEQATQKNGKYFQIFQHERGYKPGESKQKFLSNLGLAPGPVDPDKGVPYYLLIVGSPQVIPFHFQYQLDVQYAVGRIHFDTIAEYAHYARSVVAAEKGGLRLPKEVAILGVANMDDWATQLSRKHLVAPLADHVEKEGGQVRRYFDEAATVQTLDGLLGRNSSTPSLLFTASHGMGFSPDDPRQFRQQGALLCQDWPGPDNWKQPIAENFYFSADHLRSDANLLGLIAFNFACYGGGTPRYDEFAKQAFMERSEIAPAAFVSGLHKKMLGLEKGGALAAIGHVERAWGCSFLWETGKRGAPEAQLTAFTSTMTSLLSGIRVGAALEYFNQRHAELSSDLLYEIEQSEYRKDINSYELATMWTANNDARGYAITGDPAVRLCFAKDGDTQPREVIQVSSFGPTKATPAAPAAADLPIPPPVSPAETQILATTSFGLFGGDSKADGEPTPPSALQRLLDKVVGSLTTAVQDLSRLEVRTYTSSDVQAAAGQSRDALAQAGQLRAFTRIMIDGDIDAIVPEVDGTLDTQLWGLHLELVKQAQAHRAELLKTLLSLVKGS